MLLSPKALAFLAILSISAVVASPIAGDGTVEKRDAADYGNYGNYGAYGAYGDHFGSSVRKHFDEKIGAYPTTSPSPTPEPTPGYGSYGSYGR